MVHLLFGTTQTIKKAVQEYLGIPKPANTEGKQNIREKKISVYQVIVEENLIFFTACRG